MKKISPIVLLVLIIFINFSVASYRENEGGREEEEGGELFIFPHQTNQCPKNINSTDGFLINTLLLCNGGAFKKNITITFANKNKNSTILTSIYIGCDFHDENNTCEIIGLPSGKCIEIENDVAYQCTQANCSIKTHQEISSTKDEMVSRAYEEYSKKTKCQNLRPLHHGGLQGAPVPVPEDVTLVSVKSYANHVGSTSANSIMCSYGAYFIFGVSADRLFDQTIYELYFYDSVGADNIGSITRFTYNFAIRAQGEQSGGAYKNYNSFRVSADPNAILFFLGTPVEATNIKFTLINQNVTASEIDQTTRNSLVVGTNSLIPGILDTLTGLSRAMNVPGTVLNFTLSFDYGSNIFLGGVFANNLIQIKPQICLLLTEFNQAVEVNSTAGDGSVYAVDGKYCVQKSSGCISTIAPTNQNSMTIKVPSYVNRVQEQFTSNDVHCGYSELGSVPHSSDAQSEYDFFFYDSVQLNTIGTNKRFTYKLAVRAHGNTLSPEWTKNFNTFQIFADPQKLLYSVGVVDGSYGGPNGFPMQTSNINFNLLNQNALLSDIDATIPNSLLVGGTMSDPMNYENNFLNFTLSFDFDSITNVFHRLQPHVCLIVTQFNQAVQIDVNAIPQLTSQYCTQKKLGCISTISTEIPQST